MAEETFNIVQCCENETIPFTAHFRVAAETLILTKVFPLSGNQVKSLWPLVPLCRAEFCQEGLCDVETLLDHQL